MQEQKHLKKGGLLAFVTILGMAPPLSTDMYMPSLPVMAEYFNAPALLVNLTLVVFFLFMAFGTLFLGPVSDRLGRKKPLVFSLMLYLSGSLICAVSLNIWMLILARCMQAFGAGGMVSISIAIIKDCFRGRTRDTALATVQSMSVIAPIASPIIGAFIIKYYTWKMVFIVLAFIAALLIITAALFTESIHDDEINDGTIMDSIRKMAVIGRNRNFMPFLICASLYTAPFMAYLAVASYTYQDYFELTPTQFSLFFAINAGFSVLGPVSYIFISGKIKKKNIMTVLLLSGIVFSVLVYFIGPTGPVVFLCCFIPYGISTSMMRPYSTSILLDQQKGNTGAASALLNFVNTLFGSIGMLTGSLPWGSYISGLSIVMGIFAISASLVWLAILRSSSISMAGIHKAGNEL